MHEVGWVMTLQDIVDEVNRRATGRPIGRLHEWRKAIRGHRRLASRRVFDDVQPDRYAIHHGGRRELQFNIGLEAPIDGADLRFGVAFSFTLSQTLPDLEPLMPKVAHFNDYLRANVEDFANLRMWHYPPDQERVIASRPAPIKEHIVCRDSFVFLGALGRSSSPDYDAILNVLERLLPLYRFVETGGGVNVSTEPDLDAPLRLGPLSRSRWTEATTAARTLNVDLRYNALQERLRDELVDEFGREFVGIEHPAPSGGRIDVIVRTGAARRLYEIKTAATARGCIREAIGQLLDYACWPGGPPIAEIVIVGSEPSTTDVDVYLERLNRSFPIPVRYRHIVLESG